MSRKRIIPVIAAVTLLLAAWGTLRIIQISKMSDITVTASFHSKNEGGSAVRRMASPQTQAQIGYGHDPDFRPVRFKDTVLRTGLDYGPVEIRGAIPAESIRTAWPGAPFDEDWPFSIAFYNTSSGRIFHMYLDISVDTKTASAQADLYIFEDRRAQPMTAHWEGRPGEPISVWPDGMEI